MIDQRHRWNVSYKPLVVGFILSLVLIVAAFRLVTKYHLTESTLVFTLLGLAILQALIQLVFFLHMGMWAKPHWKMTTFLFMVLVVAVVIVGTLWIMDNLNYNMMPTMEH